MGRKKVITENRKSYGAKEKKPVYKRVLFWILCVLLFFIILGTFIGGDNNDNGNSANPNYDNQNTSKSRSTDSSESSLIGDKMSSPGVVGEVVSFDLNDYSDETVGVKVNGFYSSINGSSVQDYLLNENQFNPEAIDGWQWVVADTDIAYLAEDMDNEEASQTIFLDPKIIVDRQIQQKQSLVVNEDMDTHLELYNKSSVTKFIPLLIPTDLNGKNTVVRFSGFLGEDYRYIQIRSNDISEFNG